MKTIIVATDFSSAADNALQYAARMAQHTGSRLVLFNSFFLPVPTIEGMLALPDLQERITESKTKLSNLAHNISSRFQLPVETKWSLPPLKVELEELCLKYEEPLVVVGMRGNSLERKLLGSVTTALIRQGKYPVLAIPAKASFKEISKIVFACDYNSLSIQHELKPLKELALTFKSRIQILHVEKSPAFAMEEGPVMVVKKGPKLERIFRGIKHVYKEVSSDDVIVGIENGVEDFNADMLVMVPHKPDFWDKLLNRSNTRKMAFRTHIPLLALPNPQE